MKMNTTPIAIEEASNDYGNIVHEIPSAVLQPSSVQDIVDLIKSSNRSVSAAPFTVAARGAGHSVRGQAMVRGGVVVEMSSLSKNGGGVRVSGNNWSGFYADVGAEQLWIDVARATLEHGLSPVSWTDYLYLSVGGTLSNGGISGQSFLHGPQISNVLQLDVITGELLSCSENVNSELFLAVLGGLGQFGIITRARIVLEKAPTRAKWGRLIYSDFSIFTRDQEALISSNNGADYVEGFIIRNEKSSSINEWRSSFSSPSLQSNVASLLKKQGLLYSIELVKYYDHNKASTTIHQEFEMLIQGLNFIPGLNFTADVSFFDFLHRVGDLGGRKRQPDSHPWLNLFIPKSRILDFNHGVLATVIPRLNAAVASSGPIIFYPLNRNKWDDRMSAVIPEEEVFYTLGLLHSSEASEYHIIDEFNDEIMRFCQDNGIKVKQYLPHYKSKQDWIKHYGSKWETIQRRKLMFDPKFILSPAHNIFNNVYN
ncbi:cytokinin oxidase 3 [Perilla frutescens var. hirtella]|nr:cytokinin oxidase 3 [Perilla frutescens var. hirtella]